MSDDPDTGPLPELTPEQESEVRRLLAEARHDDPIPAGVGERLDQVLAGLARQEAEAPVAPVIDLAARRRRRNAAALLAGAAAVIVAGFGIGQVIDVGGSSDDNASGAGVAADNADRQAAGGAQEEAPSGTSGGAGSLSPELTKGLPLKLSSTHLRRDVKEQLSRLSTPSAYQEDVDGSAAESAACSPSPPSAYGVGRWYPATYDGVPSVLALRPPSGGHQVVDVLQCGDGTPLATVIVRAP